MTKVFLIAGEASGDALGAALMAGLKSLSADEVEFQGIAGPLMQAQGMGSLFPMDELSVMGLAEILPKYFALKRRIAETAQAIVDAKPDVVVTIDSPDFSLRVAKILRRDAPDLRIVHYVAPSVWAWRPGRAAKMAPLVDQVLALLPFEPPYLEAHGIRCDFVGHPVVAEPEATEQDASDFRAAHGIASDAPMILALPGSRRGEVRRLADTFGAALAQTVKARPNVQVVLPAAPAVAGLVEELTAAWKVPVQILRPDGLSPDQMLARKRAAFRAADVALAASGTVSLELAAANTPMVIAYDMAWLTRQIMSRMIKVDTVTLVNLVSETRAVPEFLGEACQPEPIAEQLLKTLDAPQSQQAAAQLTMERLGRGGLPPGERAAAAVLDGLAKAG